MRLLLTLVDGEEIDYKIEKDTVVIGRSSRCDLVIAHESMSRHHCKIEFRGSDIFITDLGSINGVFIDGVRIPSNSSVPFYTYLHLSFGYVTSAQLVMEENSQVGIAFPKQAKGSTKSIVDRPSEVTKTNQVKAKTDAKSHVINVMAFLTIITMMFYLLHHRDTSEKNIKKVTPQKKTPPIPMNYSDHF